MGVLPIHFILILFILNFVRSDKSDNNTIADICADTFTDLNNSPIDITKYCQGKQCIAKCCKSLNKIMYYEKSVGFQCLLISEVQNLTKLPIKINYKSIDIYRKNIEQRIEKTNKNLQDDFRFVSSEKLSKKNCSTTPRKKPDLFYVLEDATLAFEHPNYYNRWLRWKFEDYCMEYLVTKTKNGISKPFVTYRVYYAQPTAQGGSVNKYKYFAAAMLVSCIFLMLVLLVYGVIRELRNLVGIMLMAYVLTLAMTFFLKGIQILALSDNYCKPISVVIYYLILSTFCWMNIMSLDIWWTFRGMFYSRPIHRRGEIVKFSYYALYSWGIPLLVTIAAAIIDYSNISHWPHIFKPHFEFCFVITDDQPEMRYYLYYPCLALIILNWIFFLMTTFNIWRIRKNIKQFADESRTRYSNNQNRFGLYLKLALIMGVSWILEVVKLPSWLEDIGRAFNSLSGVAIFFIFVFKRKIMFMLFKRFSITGGLVEHLERKYSKYSSATASNSAQGVDVVQNADVN